jgi:hypothetical protein
MGMPPLFTASVACCIFNINFLCTQHFEAIHAQMEHEEEGKVTTKMIPDLTDVPKWEDRGSTSMSKHFRDFETYLSKHYGVEGFRLDWVVRSNLRPVFWADMTTVQAQQQVCVLTSLSSKKRTTNVVSMLPSSTR